MIHYLSKLESTVKRNWDSVALANFKGESFTYGELATNIEKFHLFFEAAGFEKGQKMTVCARNTARWAISFFAVNTYEAVAVPLLNEFTPDSISNLISHSGSVVLFTDSDLWPKLDISKMPELMAVISATDFTLLYSRTDEIKEAFESVPSLFSTKYPLGFNRENVSYPKDNGGDLAIINYTSGTTSAPKGVMLRYESLSTMLQFALENCQVDEKDDIVSMLPMGHIYGLVVEMTFPLINGCTVHFFGKTPSPTVLLKAMKEVRPFMVVAVPLVMEKIYKSSIKPVIGKWYMKILLAIPGIGGLIYRKMGRKIMDAFGGKVRKIILGGAGLNPEVEKCFKKMRIPFTVGYGMTEASPLLCYEHWKKFVPGSCGKPICYVDVKIDSEDPENIAGEILAKGVTICAGYYDNPEASANAFTEDGYLRTGDLGIMDSDGNVFIKGRSKSMILSANGQNIYPEEVEAVINAQSFVAESLVVDRNSKLVALIYLDKDAIKRAGMDEESISDIPENIRVNSNKVLPPYSQITKVEIVLEPFEKTPKLSIKRFLYK